MYLLVVEVLDIVEIESGLEAVAGYEHLEGVLLDREHVGVLVDASIAKEQLAVQVDRRSARVLCHLVSIVHVVARLLQVVLVQQLRIGRVRVDRSRQQTKIVKITKIMKKMHQCTSRGWPIINPT